MNKIIHSLFGVFTMTLLMSLLLACGSNNSTDGPKIGKKDDTPTTPRKVPTGADPSVSAEDGGNGFEEIAAEQGWQTNTKYTSPGSPAAKSGGSITMATDEYPATFRDAGKNSNYQIVSVINSFIFEPLLGFDAQSLEYYPILATHWKISEDKTEYSFRLNPDARWSDGKPVVSDDVIATYNLLVDKGLEDPFANDLYSSYYETPTKKSKYIFSVKTKKENWRSFLYFAASMKIYPHYHLAKTDGAGYLEKYQYDFMPNSGPYELDKEATKKNELLVIKRRDNFWAKDYPENIGLYNFDQIKFLVVREERLRLEKFKAGETDFYIVPRAQWWAEEVNEEYPDIKRGVVTRQKIYNFDPVGTGGLAMNTKREPFNDIRVREAIGYLFNFDQLNKTLFFDEYVRLNSFYPSSPYAHPNNPTPEYNPEKAVALLKDAGWTKKAGQKWMTNAEGKNLSFEMMSDKSIERIFVPFQQDLEKIGIELKFNNVDPNERFKKVKGKDFAINYQNWTGLFFPNPYNSMHSKFADIPDNNNITGLANKRIDALCDLYDASYDAKERARYIQEIDSIAVAQKHWVFGWGAPHTLRILYWNKFDLPESGVAYTGDFEQVFGMWWADPEKEALLEKAKKDKNMTMPKGPAEIDYWGKKSGQSISQK